MILKNIIEIHKNSSHLKCCSTSYSMLRHMVRSSMCQVKSSDSEFITSSEIISDHSTSFLVPTTTPPLLQSQQIRHFSSTCCVFTTTAEPILPKPNIQEVDVKSLLADNAKLPQPPTVSSSPALATGDQNFSAQIPSSLKGSVHENVTAFLEPAFSTLSLASWWPWGRVQRLMEIVHVNIGMSWPECVFIVSVVTRLLSFPIMIKNQKNISKFIVVQPKISKLSTQVQEAKKRNDMFTLGQSSKELQSLYSKTDISLIRMMLPIGGQVALFVTTTTAIRQMANLPLESLENATLFWMKDLTLGDPLYILPVASGLSLFALMKYAMDSQNARYTNAAVSYGSSAQKTLMRRLIFVPPLILTIVSMKMPAILVQFFLLNNSFALIQSMLLRNAKIRNLVKLPPLTELQAQTSGVMTEKMKEGGAKDTKKKSTLELIKEAYHKSIDTASVASDVNDRRRYDETRFRQAGKAKRQNVYKFDPTKPMKAKSSL